MRIRLKKSALESTPSSPTEGNGPRVNQRQFLKTVAAAVSAATVAQIARGPETALANTMSGPVTIQGPADSTSQLILTSPNGQMVFNAGYTDGYAYFESGNASFDGNANGLKITGYYGNPLTNLTLVAGVVNTSGNVSVNQSLNVDDANVNGGSVSPGIAFGQIGNTGEGIASQRMSGGNQYGLDFYTGDASRMSITNGGNVGIGTPNPLAALDVAGVARLSYGLLVQRDVDGTTPYRPDQVVLQGATTPTLRMYVGLDTVNQYGLIQAVNDSLAWRNIVLVRDGGYVGIGTASPTALLTLNGSGSFVVGATKIADQNGSYYS